MTEAAGLTIVAAGNAASGITGELAAQNEEAFQKKYYQGFVQSAKCVTAQDHEIEKVLSDRETIGERAFRTDTAGVYDTLWEIGEAYACGLTVDALKIPILTETVEICELLDLDPFALPSKGIWFILTAAPAELADCLTCQGIPAETVGQLTGNKARILKIGERQRFLARPDQTGMEKQTESQSDGEEPDPARGE